MKTPREILLERHRRAEPELNRIRHETLEQLTAPASTQRPETARTLVRTVLEQAWRQLIWPARRAWAGMMLLWLVVTAVNLEMKTTMQAAPGGQHAAIRELAQGLQEQRRLLSELLQPPGTPLAEPPRPNPRPRSERQSNFKTC